MIDYLIVICWFFSFILSFVYFVYSQTAIEIKMLDKVRISKFDFWLFSGEYFSATLFLIILVFLLSPIAFVFAYVKYKMIVKYVSPYGEYLKQVKEKEDAEYLNLLKKVEKEYNEKIKQYE